MDFILELSLILIGAKLGATLLGRFGGQALLGEILMGVILGSSVLGLIHNSQWLHNLSDIGIIFLVLSLGLDTKISQIRAVGMKAILVATGGILFPFFACFFLGKIYGFSDNTALFLAVTASLSGVPVTARIFMDLGMTRSGIFKTVLASALLDDIVGFLMLAAIFSLSGIQKGQASLGMLLVRLVLFFMVLIPMAWFLVPRLLSRVEVREGHVGLFSMVLSPMFLFSYLAKWAGLDSIVGAFFFGVILGQSIHSLTIQRQVEPVYYFLAPIFFISVGVQVDLKALSLNMSFALLLTILAIGSKAIGAGLFALLGRIPLKEAAVIGVGMVPRGVVGLIVAGMGKKWGLFDLQLFSSATLMCFLSIVVAPPLLRALIKGMSYDRDEDESKRLLS